MSYFRLIMYVPMTGIGIYLFFRLRAAAGFYGFRKKSPWVNLAAALAAVLIALQCRSVWSTGTMLVLHIVIFSVVLDLAAALGRLLFRRRDGRAGLRRVRRTLHILYGCGLIPLVLTAGVLTYGYYNMNHIRQTEYTVTTEKNIREEGYRLLLITDVHYGTIQDPEILKESVKRFNAAEPDLVILGGDIVEEGTSKENMREVFSVLGGLESRFGVYYVYGNHDRQPYTGVRTFTDGELAAAIEESGIEILRDRVVTINGELVLAGRDDVWSYGRSARKPMAELLGGVDSHYFVIAADHQPVQAEENDAAGVDLQVSGHTHAGQIWPVGVLTELLGGLNYGEYTVGSCRVIVSSGFAGWGYSIRTGEHSEYVLIDILPADVR